MVPGSRSPRMSTSARLARVMEEFSMQLSSTTARHRLARRVIGVGAVAGLTVTGLVMTGPAASAAVAVFPNNVVVFPDRDFVSVEGYKDHAGETATLTVTRDGKVMGAAEAKVSGGEVAFEVNHPGGVCWGNQVKDTSTLPQVTPDIKAGDVVSISFPDGAHDETTTSSATVIKDMTRNGTTVTVEGTFGSDVKPDNMEQRIINPDLVDVVGKRDVRALPGPVVPAPKGGYSSGMDIAADGTFVATYVFDTLEGAETTAAADLGERAMSWQVVDADGNRQGLTIAEYGEAGGPGMGGCPMGPGDQSAPDGTASVVRPASDKSTAVVNWNPTAAQPGADAVSGYSVEAINSATQAVTGNRVGANATQATLGGLSTDPSVTYTFEVRSMTGAAPAQKLSVPFTMGGAAGTPGDTTQPNLTVSPKGGALNTEQGPDATTAVEASSVTVASNGQVFFT